MPHLDCDSFCHLTRPEQPTRKSVSEETHRETLEQSETSFNQRNNSHTVNSCLIHKINHHPFWKCQNFRIQKCAFGNNLFINQTSNQVYSLMMTGRGTNNIQQPLRTSEVRPVFSLKILSPQLICSGFLSFQ